MGASVFETAKAHITRSLIESYFPGGEWRGDGEYWCLSPLRADRTIGSFHISPEGVYYDMATKEGGGFIDLVALSSSVTPKAAAEEIVKRSGGTLPESKSPARKKKEKIEAVIPIPPESGALLNREIVGDWAKKQHGRATAGWKYHTADGGWAFSVVRYEDCPTGQAKEVVPYYWGADSRWHEGQAYPDGRPLFNLHTLAAAEKILIVEGEKCAMVKVEGYTLTTWSAGCESVSKTAWLPLEEAAKEGRVWIWPDADKQCDKKSGNLLPWDLQPGMKAAIAIANRLPGAKILDVQSLADIKGGYDIADMVEEGGDPAAFIETAEVYKAPEGEAADRETSQFFRCLGYDDERYWFLREGKRTPQSITMGKFTSSALQELAPLAWWGVMGLTGDQGSIKTHLVQDFIIGIQDRIGRHNPDLLRGAGVWRDQKEIIANDGRRIVTRSGELIEYPAYQSRAHYISSDVTFGDLFGGRASDEEGQALVELFDVQNWVRPSHALAALGWCLIAPFGGILKWRPHIWVSGRKGTGKSYVLDNIITPLLGDFAYKGSGKDSEAGIRRSLRTDARPVVLDEMEPLDKKSAEKVTSILTLARNASSDASGYMTIAGPDGGTIRYRVRSCFCFASIQVPDRGAAIESRIIRTELKWGVGPQMKIKRDRTTELSERCMRDPGRFRRRIFHLLPQILENIEALRTDGLLNEIGDQRQADQWAPIIAAAYALIDEGAINSERGREFLGLWLSDIASLSDERVEDEDRVIEHILGAQIETDAKTRRTIGELLVQSSDFASTTREDSKALLQRYGIKIISYKGHDALAIAKRSDAIAKILVNTPYEAGYDAQIRRHPLCLNPQSDVKARMGQVTSPSRLLDWEQFKVAYLKAEGE